MINRVLIRIKVVQMLYSYLLTQSEFRIMPAPEADDSRDNKFAYRTYADMLLMLLELSGRNARGAAVHGEPLVAPNKYFADSAMISSLAANTDIRTLMNKYGSGLSAYDDCICGLFQAITSSAAYRSYTHAKERDLSRDVAFWTNILRTVIFKSPEFIECARRNPSFTLAGFEKGLKMTTETLENYSDSRRLFTDATASLERSLDKAYELYHALLLLPVELTALQAERLETARNKYLPTDEELNPNLKFIDNKFVAAVSESPSMLDYLDEHPFSWVGEQAMLRSILDKIVESDIYKDYMSKPSGGDKSEDCELWRQLFKQIILPGDDIAEALESKSVYWNDDIDIMGTFVLKTIKRFGQSDDDTLKLLPKYKDDEDARFGASLFVSAIRNKDRYREYIDMFINEQHWDPERLALMDIVIMIAAITELLDYPAIPIPVTLNEYIEIANSYSTPRSGQFINGILYSVIKYLKEQGLLNKN